MNPSGDDTARLDVRPESPTDLSGRSWWGIAMRTQREFRAKQLTDRAAALTYYGVLALFPALLALVSILGVVGQSATGPLLDNLSTVSPGPARTIFTNAIHGLQGTKGSSLVLLVAGFAGAIWSASGYIGAFMRASNAIYGVEEGRPFIKLRPLQLVITLVTVIAVALSAVAVVFTGGLASSAGDVIGVGSSAVTVWEYAKWPVLLVIVSLMFSLLYWTAPNVRQPRFRWITPGGVFAVIAWILVSLAFAGYVAGFASYNKTYGSLGGVIAFLVWLWLTNVVLLLGAQLNAEVERARKLDEGQPVERDLHAIPRVDPADEPDDPPRARSATP